MVNRGNRCPAGFKVAHCLAKYDGPNAGAEVWDLNGLAGTITIPAVGLVGQNYGLSGWTLFSQAPIPEPGTAGLVGLGVLGLIGAIRKRWSA
jgi:PEP-CTERM motif